LEFCLVENGLRDSITLTSVDSDTGTQAPVGPIMPVNITPTVSELANSLQQSNLNDNPPSQFIDSCDSLRNLIGILSGLPTEPPSLYLDLEGVDLSRHGTISILQIYVSPKDHTYLIDVYSLREETFLTTGIGGQTLKAILESSAIPKVFFDVRNDSDALYAHFGVKLAGVQDIQLMELATRRFSKRYVNGLSRCIERDAEMTAIEKQIWKSVKERGQKLFDPGRGGSYEVFNVRPLAGDITAYCIQDVRFMPKLWAGYSSKLTPQWATKVDKATKERVALSQSDTFNGKGGHMALGPWLVSDSVRRKTRRGLS
jgi:exonuclease 3'-5' domain-containing protein 1